MARDKESFDLKKVIDHHEYEDGVELTFMDYQTELTVDVEVMDGSGSRVRLSHSEVEQIFVQFNSYKAARDTVIKDGKE